MRYCTHCGNPLAFEIPHGDDRPRHICRSCGAIHYENPKMVVGCIPQSGSRILLCRRAIEPRYGKWTIPAGYLENQETVAEGARREAFEEARLRMGELIPYRLYNIRHISQMYLIFLGKIAEENYRPGVESLEVRLFTHESIPWDDLAFRVVAACLKNYFSDRESGAFPFRIGEILPDEIG